MAKLDLIPPMSRLALHKKIIREAAFLARSELFNNKSLSHTTDMMVLGTVARAVGKGDINLARHVASKNDTAKSFLHITGNRVFMRNPAEFGLKFLECRSEHVEISKSELESSSMNGGKAAWQPACGNQSHG